MLRYRLIETHAGTLTRRREMSDGELRREHPELGWLLDEGLTSLSIVTARRELNLRRIDADQERLRLALEHAGILVTDEEVARLISALRPPVAELQPSAR
jgi:hypothetical protein